MKMSDVFDLPLKDYRGSISSDEVIGEITFTEACDAIAFSVNHHDQLVEALNDLLNDCINFDGGKLSDCYMKQASELLKTIKGESGL